jgi:hypothetical protein
VMLEIAISKTKGNMKKHLLINDYYTTSSKSNKNG